jgi:trimethylamine--corrinoid protein Co-methyltransferase
MRSDFLYPEIANRQPIEQWEKEGKNDIFSVAKIRVQELLTKAKPSHLPESIEQKIRSEFQIYLDRYEDA